MSLPLATGADSVSQKFTTSFSFFCSLLFGIFILGVDEMCQFLSLHHPWERVSLCVFSGTYRQIVSTCDPSTLQEKIRTSKDLKWFECNMESHTQSTYYAAMLLAAKSAVVEADCQSSVIVFATGIRDTVPAGFGEMAMKLLDRYPLDYWQNHFLPLPFSSFLFFIRFSGESQDAQLLNKNMSKPFPYLLKRNVSRGGFFTLCTAVPLETKATCDMICKKLYTPWTGQLELKSAKYAFTQKETFCLFPNPWGYRGLGGVKAHPAVIVVTQLPVASEVSFQKNAGNALVLPQNMCPPLWRSEGRESQKSLKSPLKWNLLDVASEENYSRSLHSTLINKGTSINPSGKKVGLCCALDQDGNIMSHNGSLSSYTTAPPNGDIRNTGGAMTLLYYEYNS